MKKLWISVDEKDLRSTPKQTLEFLRNTKPLTPREEANAITCYAFRNGFIEDLHAGEHSKLLESQKYSRITDEEMKKLMIESSAKIEQLLAFKKDGPKDYEAFIRAYHLMYTKNWDKKKKVNPIIKKLVH